MKIKIAFFFLLSACVFLLLKNMHKNESKGAGAYIQYNDTSSSDALYVNGKVNFKFTGTDGIPYYFSMSDTVPSFPFALPHLLLSQGDPYYLHSVLALDNNSRTNDDSLNAVIGVLDNHGMTNNVLRATTGQIGIQTTLAGDSSGGAFYGFTKDGLVLKRGSGTDFGLMYMLTNHKGAPGQVLMLNKSGDTATWQNPTSSPVVMHQYFVPTEAHEVGVLKSRYNIINPVSGLQSLTIRLPAFPEDNDWFELTFTQPIKTIIYTGGKTANNAIKTASSSSCYKKFVFRKDDETWY